MYVCMHLLMQRRRNIKTPTRVCFFVAERMMGLGEHKLHFSLHSHNFSNNNKCTWSNTWYLLVCRCVFRLVLLFLLLRFAFVCFYYFILVLNLFLLFCSFLIYLSCLNYDKTFQSFVSSLLKLLNLKKNH